MMRRIILLALMGSLIMGSLATWAASEGRVVSQRGVKVRSLPNDRVVGGLPYDTRVTVLSQSRGWAQIRLPSGKVGYVIGRALQVSDSSRLPASGKNRNTVAGTCRKCKEKNNLHATARKIKKVAKEGRDKGSIVQGRYAPIMKPFRAAFQSCAAGCSYQDWGVWGDRRHRARRSCHNSGSAIDIPSITCKGKRYAAGSKRFREFTQCMNRTSALYVIFGKGEHKHHAHISLEKCERGGVGKVRG